MKHSRAGAWIDRPQTISCGQCINCLLERSRHFAGRIVHEAQLHEANSFLTLTLSDSNLGVNLSLDIKHWQNFAHRLRKEIAPKKLRFYHCGEYSDPPKMRPHYHACIMGLDWSKDREIYKTTDQGHTLYTSEKLDATWKLGKCWIGDLTFESAAYVARYMMKKITGPNAQLHYKHIDKTTGEIRNLKPEYTTSCRNPGIGHAWINKFYPEVYGNKEFPKDYIVINGRKQRPSKYYDDQLERIDPDLLKHIKAKRIREANKHTDDNTTERLIVKEQCAMARFNFMQRELQ